jgi:hypothetical protein
MTDRADPRFPMDESIPGGIDVTSKRADAPKPRYNNTSFHSYLLTMAKLSVFPSRGYNTLSFARVRQRPRALC